MQHRTPSLWKLYVIALLVPNLVFLPAATASKGKQSGGDSGVASYSGQATAVRATLLGITTVISDTGPLPSSGGARDAHLLAANVPGLLTAEVAHAATVGQGDASRSEASVANLNLTVGGNTIAADFLMARAAAVCTRKGVAISGSSEILNLRINGQSIVAGTQPNQTVTLPNGRVIINEQNGSTGGNFGEITATALHVIVDGIADVVISTAHADIDCQGPPPCPGGDFVTGGGWITGTPSGARASFGVAGGLRNRSLWGHLVYVDHGSGMKVKGTGVTLYQVVNETTRHIEGTAEVNGQGGLTYQVDVSDNGEPGRDDVFTLRLSNDYVASGSLRGGNIQLHKCR